MLIHKKIAKSKLIFTGYAEKNDISTNMNPIAAPTDFLKKDIKGYLYTPNITSFKNSKTAIHEYLGIVWSKIKL